MTKLYMLNCRDVGIECDFVARGGTIEEVVEQCTDHGRAEHEMRAFRPDFFAKMRGCVRVIEDGVSDKV
jgi:predicted small metal-binding protein